MRDGLREQVEMNDQALNSLLAFFVLSHSVSQLKDVLTFSSCYVSYSTGL